MPPPKHPADQAEATDSVSGFLVVVDRFPFGHAGAPISTSGMHQEGTANDSGPEALGDTIWSPFRSQCDWEIAHWAKMCGPSSTALVEFLVIAEVCQQLQYLL